jgi:hypothetical protein
VAGPAQPARPPTRVQATTRAASTACVRPATASGRLAPGSARPRVGQRVADSCASR